MSKKKTLLTILAVMLVCCIAVVGTLAFLTETTDKAVVNTFTAAGGGKLIDELYVLCRRLAHKCAAAEVNDTLPAGYPARRERIYIRTAHALTAQTVVDIQIVACQIGRLVSAQGTQIFFHRRFGREKSFTAAGKQHETQ